MMKLNKKKIMITVTIVLFLALLAEIFAFFNIEVSEKYETQWITKDEIVQKEVNLRAAQLTREKRSTVITIAVIAVLLYYSLYWIADKYEKDGNNRKD